MLWHNKGQYQDIPTKWLRFQVILNFQENFKTILKFQKLRTTGTKSLTTCTVQSTCSQLVGVDDKRNTKATK